jgi:hypothetical protein
MPLSADLYANGQGVLQVWLSLPIATPKLKKDAQFEEARRSVEVSFPKVVLADPQGALQVGLGLIVEAVVCQGRAVLAQRLGGVRDYRLEVYAAVELRSFPVAAPVLGVPLRIADCR